MIFMSRATLVGILCALLTLSLIASGLKFVDFTESYVRTVIVILLVGLCEASRRSLLEVDRNSDATSNSPHQTTIYWLPLVACPAIAILVAWNIDDNIVGLGVTSGLSAITVAYALRAFYFRKVLE